MCPGIDSCLVIGTFTLTIFWIVSMLSRKYIATTPAGTRYFRSKCVCVCEKAQILELSDIFGWSRWWIVSTILETISSRVGVILRWRNNIFEVLLVITWNAKSSRNTISRYTIPVEYRARVSISLRISRILGSIWKLSATRGDTTNKHESLSIRHRALNSVE